MSLDMPKFSDLDALYDDKNAKVATAMYERSRPLRRRDGEDLQEHLGLGRA
ncbi:hypothetical protein [Celeribacter indicus]|uniref:hypothetical protein n=1 Tax=Celeribacter indicus TaxID=1208324 RepID=UPI0020C90D55|nr:hypothetical protein [Celeribacter indicus]